jgi:ankyrin repeat protein
VRIFAARYEGRMMTAILIAADLLSAIQAQDLPRVREILSRNPELVNVPDSNGVYPASHALGVRVGEGFLPRRENKVLDEILAHHPKLTREQTCAMGTARQVRALLAEDPAFVKSVAKNGWTPLHFAAFGDNAEAAGVLIEGGAELDARAKNKFDNTPLHVAQLDQSRAVTKLLIEKGADVNAASPESGTPLEEAASSGDVESIRMLLAAGATGARARDLALKNKHPDAAALLP